MTVMNQQMRATGTELRDEERTRCEVWTRVMGYHRPVSEFNAGKQSEHRERKHFTECHVPANR
jgi:anaerobic ribonucleoside-triphosphate reductase